MQTLEVDEETVGQHADLATRKRDPVIGLQGNANLFPLPVAKKPFQPDMNHDVVADDATRRDEVREHSRPLRSPAAGNTYPDRLPQTETSMAQRHAGALPCFRDPRGLAADGTGSIALLCTDEYAGNTPRPLPALFFDLPDRLPQGCDLRERDRATVFFTP